MTQLRIGVVGTGLQWQGSHRPIMLAMPESFTVTAFVGRKPESQQRFLADFSQAKSFPDHQSLIDSGLVDALVVSTPIALNAPVTIAALNRGLHVFVEKPFVMSLEEARGVITAQKNSKGRVFILENLLYADFWNQLRDVVHQGSIGTPVLFDRASHGFFDPANDPYGFANTSWRLQNEFPLGPLFDGGIHEVAFLQKLFGVPKFVNATGLNFRPEHGEYDVINMMWEYDNGFTGLWTFSSLIGGQRNYFHIRGTEGLVVFDYHTFTLEPKSGTPKTFSAAEDPGKFWPTLHPVMYREFLDCIATGREPRYTIADSFHDVATLMAVRESIKTGRKVPVATA